MTPIHILYGTETYNSEDLAERTGEALTEAGFTTEVVDMSDFELADLATLHTLLIVTSTFGNGEPPSNAEEFHEYVMEGAAALPHLRFSVCALGDTDYELFCQCGKEFDQRLEELGAQRIVPRQDCNTDYEEPWEAWLAQLLQVLPGLDFSASGAPPVVVEEPEPDDEKDSVPAVSMALQPVPAPVPITPKKKGKKVAKIGTRKNPFFATVIENYNLNEIESAKETRHVALSLEGSGIDYKVGDALGIFPRNCPDLVRRILQEVGIPRDTPVEYENVWYSIRDVLIYKRDVMQIDRKMMAMAASGPNGSEFQPILDDKKAQTEYIAKYHLIDFVTAASISPSPDQFVSCLRPLAPRLYSIASSPRAHPGEVHLTVNVLRYDMHELYRKGVSSTFLGERAGPGVEVAVYLQPTNDFVLCADELPIIMIGPGTGIAPFRAMLEEREARGAPGQSWLFFGSQKASTDFLYRDQLVGYVDDGRLAQLDLAWSRDQDKKVYVQDLMYENGAGLFNWLEAGACIYICGDATRMAKDVHQTFVRIISEVGGRSAEQAEEYMKRLSAEKRYLRDVY